jgi:phenylpyruvate tautomerase PptA (4-oxalocrotonate tautomerase family)
MPLIKVQTSMSAPEPTAVEGILKTLSSKLAGHVGKPESYVMTSFEPDVAMTFGGSSDSACYIEIKSVGTISSGQTSEMSQDFCQAVEQHLGVPANRTYIEFAGAEGAMWGWNGGTFG